MAEQIYGALSIPVSVIGSDQYIEKNGIDIIVNTKSNLLPKGDLLFTDINDNILFTVKSCNTAYHFQWLLVDGYGKPKALLRNKIRSIHGRWNVFRGDSKEDLDLIFSTKTPHVIQFKSILEVFLAKNTNEDDCDFKINGSLSQKNCTVYAGGSTILAQMHRNQPSENIRLGKHKFVVTVYPNVDYAFVVALISITHAMKRRIKASDDVGKSIATGLVNGAFNIMTGGTSN